MSTGVAYEVENIMLFPLLQRKKETFFRSTNVEERKRIISFVKKRCTHFLSTKNIQLRHKKRKLLNLWI